MSDRRAAERRGRLAEGLAAFALQLKGYRILARRSRTPRGELDLVALRGDCLVFVEVKARASLELALSAVTPGDWMRLSQAAQSWADARATLGSLGHRHDLVAVVPRRWPIHVRDAWRPDFAATRR